MGETFVETLTAWVEYDVATNHDNLKKIEIWIP